MTSFVNVLFDWLDWWPIGVGIIAVIGCWAGYCPRRWYRPGVSVSEISLRSVGRLQAGALWSFLVLSHLHMRNDQVAMWFEPWQQVALILGDIAAFVLGAWLVDRTT